MIDCAAENKTAPNSIEKKSFYKNFNCGCNKDVTITQPSYRIGLPLDEFQQKLKKQKSPDEIYVSVNITYYWRGAHEIIEICKKVFPNAKITMGGIYPTLCSKHASQSGAKIFEGELKDANDFMPDITLLDYIPDYIILKSTRGCPNNCSYCAVHKLEGKKIRFKCPRNILEEIEYFHKKYNITNFVFWESNILINQKKHIEVILDGIINNGYNIRIEFPEGFSPTSISDHLAKKMKEAGAYNITLALETVDDSISKRFHRINQSDGFLRALKCFKDAGYKEDEINAFILIGMPNQCINTIIKSMIFVWKHGCKIKIMPFTPIPTTEEYEKYYEIIKEKSLEELHPLLIPFAKTDEEVMNIYILGLFNNKSDPISTIDKMDDKYKDTKLIKNIISEIKKSDEIIRRYYETNYTTLPWVETIEIAETVIYAYKNKFLNKGSILDIGCGKGTNSIFLQEHGFDTYGIDVSKKAIENLDSKITDRNNFIVNDIFSYTGKFDNIIDIGCFHMIPKEKHKKYVQKIHSLLKKEGIYILRVFSQDGYLIKKYFPARKNNNLYVFFPKKTIRLLFKERFMLIKIYDSDFCLKKENEKFNLVPGMHSYIFKKILD